VFGVWVFGHTLYNIKQIKKDREQQKSDGYAPKALSQVFEEPKESFPQSEDVISISLSNAFKASNSPASSKKIFIASSQCL
jgi:hypothetical protein